MPTGMRRQASCGMQALKKPLSKHSGLAAEVAEETIHRLRQANILLAAWHHYEDLSSLAQEITPVWELTRSGSLRRWRRRKKADKGLLLTCLYYLVQLKW